MRVAWPLLLAAAALANSCGPKLDPNTLNGTALFVTSWFDSDYKVRSLLFIGETSTGNDAFQRASRPDPKSATDLNGPLTARILLKDALIDEEIALSVFALDLNDELVEYGYKTVKVVGGRETDVRVDLSPFVVEVDAGVPDAGDAGRYFDAGTQTDGGTRCDCDAGCCVVNSNPDGGPCTPVSSLVVPLPNGIPSLNFTSQLCGAPGAFCALENICDPPRSNTCKDNRCSCGALGAPCPAGNRCAQVNGVFTCVCDAFSNCDGCCPKLGGLCKPAAGDAGCGAAGQACESCAGGAVSSNTCSSAAFGVGACATSPNCPTCTKSTECCTGNACSAFGYPTCRARPAGVPSVCESCDLLRADKCDGVTGRCACGSGNPCGPFQLCTNGSCRAI